MKQLFKLLMYYALCVLLGMAICFLVLKMFEESKTTSEVKVTGYAIYETKESEVIRITQDSNSCEVMSGSGFTGSRLFHYIKFEVCPNVKIGDKVKVTIKVMK